MHMKCQTCSFALRTGRAPFPGECPSSYSAGMTSEKARGRSAPLNCTEHCHLDQKRNNHLMGVGLVECKQSRFPSCRLASRKASRLARAPIEGYHVKRGDGSLDPGRKATDMYVGRGSPKGATRTRNRRDAQDTQDTPRTTDTKPRVRDYCLDTPP